MGHVLDQAVHVAATTTTNGPAWATFTADDWHDFNGDEWDGFNVSGEALPLLDVFVLDQAVYVEAL